MTGKQLLQHIKNQMLNISIGMAYQAFALYVFMGLGEKAAKR